MNLIVVYNEKSGSEFTRERLESLIDPVGIIVDEWVPVNDSLKSKLAPHIKSGQTIAVVGGDGTQRSLAALIAGATATMAPLPGGTLNHFAKDLNVPQQMDEAISRLPSLRPRMIDVARVNGKVFVNNSTIGLYPHSLLEREKTERKLGKWPAAIRASIFAFMHFRLYHLTVQGRKVRTPFIFIGNNQYDFDSSITAERRSLAEGALTLFVMRSRSRLSAVKAALIDRFAMSRPGKDTVIIEQPTSVTIEGQIGEIAVSLDGEVEILRPPLKYTIEPKALKVLV